MLKGIRTDECFSLSSPQLSCLPSAQHCSEFCCALMVSSCCALSNLFHWQKAPNQAVCLPGLRLFWFCFLDVPGCLSISHWCGFRTWSLRPWGKNDLAAMDPRNHHRVVCGVYGAVPQAPLDCWVLLCVGVLCFLFLLLQKAVET